MFTAEELINNIEFQTEINYCYYDDKKEERVIISDVEAMDKVVTFIYCENNELYFEVEMFEAE